jgi:hypothetical protein
LRTAGRHLCSFVGDSSRTGFIRHLTLFGLISLSVALTACDHRELRGSTKTSSDGGTYLSVDDNNGGSCGPILVDGKAWPHPIGQPGAINPGRHEIDCGGSIDFAIAKGVVFHFDYWGP